MKIHRRRSGGISEISIATFRRYVQAGKITAHSSGNAHLYPLAALRALKKPSNWLAAAWLRA